MSHGVSNNVEPNENSLPTSDEFMQRAMQAHERGDDLLAVHLYLAAFEQAFQKQEGEAQSSTSQDKAVEGLRQAWQLSCACKDRCLAEHILGKLEPFLSKKETKEYTLKLQDLALDKLEEIGLRRADLEEIAQSISQEVFGLEQAPQIRIDAVHQIKMPLGTEADKNTDEACDSKSCCHTDAAQAHARHEKPQANEELEDLSKTILFPPQEPVSYKTLVGFDETIKVMRSLGVGMSEDPEHQKLVNVLNSRHGLIDSPSPDSLLFRSPAREDASRFMEATLGELGLPGVRMHIEENWQGMLMLCLSAQKSKEFTFNTQTSRFEGRGVLLLEDIDLWEFPQPTEVEDALNAIMLAQMSRGAREALNLIRAAVTNPDVYVLATASSEGPIEPFLLDLLGPMTEVDIAYPTPGERAALWIDLAKKHPSIRAINRVSLVRFSANLARYDICMAARDAVEDAYKQGLRAGKYLPVQPYNLFEKIAAYQPLDSKEYAELEDALVRDFGRGLNAGDVLSKGL